MNKSIGWALSAFALVLTSGSKAATVLITGSDRGIGFEFASEYAERGWSVIATTRRPETAAALKALAIQFPNIVIEKLDVLDEPGIKELAAKYAGKPIDLIVSNAGVSGNHQGQTFGSFDYANFQQVMGVNAYGVLAVSEAFWDNVKRSDQKKIVAITSGSGTISRGKGDAVFYRMSKVALNMAMVVLAQQLHDSGVVFAMLAPGTVITKMPASPERLAKAIPIKKSVASMIKVIDRLTQANSDKPINYDGTILPW